MQIRRSRNNAELSLDYNEIKSLIKILNFTLKELKYEYFTRTGFEESKTEKLITDLKKKCSEKGIQQIKLTHQQIFNLRQNLVEILFGIKIEDHKEFLGMSKEDLTSQFKLLDKYCENHKIW